MSELKNKIISPEEMREELKKIMLASHHKETVARGLSKLIFLCHTASYNRGWWRDQASGEPLLCKEGLPAHLEPYVKSTKLLLTVSEIGECMEGFRCDLADDKLPEFSMETVEIADAIIRLCDYAGAYDLPVVEAILKKMDFNAVRKDHDPAVRKASGGKKF